MPINKENIKSNGILSEMGNSDKNETTEQKQVKSTPSKKDSFRVRLMSLITLLLTIGIGLTLWFLPLVRESIYSDANTNLSVFNGFLNLLQDGMNGVFKIDISLIKFNTYVHLIRGMDYAGGLVMPFGLFIIIVIYLAIMVQSIVRLITGRTLEKGIFITALAFVFVQIILVGIALLAQKLDMSFISNIGVSLYVVEAMSLLILVLSFFNIRTNKKSSKWKMFKKRQNS